MVYIPQNGYVCIRADVLLQRHNLRDFRSQLHPKASRVGSEREASQRSLPGEGDNAQWKLDAYLGPLS
jgi:hypothetical protein